MQESTAQSVRGANGCPPECPETPRALVALGRGEMKGDRHCTYTEQTLLPNTHTLLHSKGTQGQTRCQAALTDSIIPNHRGLAPGRTTEPEDHGEPPVTFNPAMNHESIKQEMKSHTESLPDTLLHMSIAHALIGRG